MYLSDNFIAQFEGRNPPFGGNGLGAFVYLRTYSRWLEDKGRRETWAETIRRVVEYSMSLYQGPATKTELVLEAQKLFEEMFNLRMFPAGRTLWVGGTEAAKKFPTANFNCAFVVIDSYDAFTEAFFLLMVGAGVGFRVLPEDVANLPTLHTNVVLANKPYNPKPKNERIELTQVYEERDDDGKASVYIIVGDSKEGWVESLTQYFKAMQRTDVDAIIINYDSVRSKGEVLKTFGGRASGHEALRNMFKAIHKTIRNSKGGKLSPLNAGDIMNHIGYNVVVGGVRRTSEIMLFGENDNDVLNAKVDLYTPGSPNYGNFQRAMSNNSIVFTSKPNREKLVDIFGRISNMAEPGFINLEAARKRRPWAEGVNPCAEILLASRGVCNLTEVNLSAFVNGDSLNYRGLLDAVELAVRIGLRQTNVTLDLPTWDAVQKRDRLTGVSLTGVVDAMDALDYDAADMEVLLNDLNVHANTIAVEYAKEMRVPTPLLVTTTKPSGTISKLPTVSSGIHRSVAPFYIQRVRISSSDPLAKVMLELGYPVYPETAAGMPSANEFDNLSRFDQVDVLQRSNTWVIEFPVKTTATTRAVDESAITQFKRYLSMQNNWTDHNTSITIYYKEEEVPELIDIILKNWDSYIGVSFFPVDTSTYPLLPQEPIDELEYNRRAIMLEHITPDKIVRALQAEENGNLATELEDADCTTGACPIR